MACSQHSDCCLCRPIKNVSIFYKHLHAIIYCIHVAAVSFRIEAVIFEAIKSVHYLALVQGLNSFGICVELKGLRCRGEWTFDVHGNGDMERKTFEQ